MGLNNGGGESDFGPFGPSFKENGLQDGVVGKIVHMALTNAKKYNSTEDAVDARGNKIPEYVVTLQTELRNWDRVAKVPTGRDDEGNDTKVPMPASEDTGIRKIYAKWGNMTRLEQALNAACPTLEEPSDAVGLTLKVKLDKLVPTDKGNDRKDFAYKAEGTPDAPATDGLSNTAEPTAATPPAAAPQQEYNEPPF